jgi:hypothetical protein
MSREFSKAWPKKFSYTPIMLRDSLLICNS